MKKGSKKRVVTSKKNTSEGKVTRVVHESTKEIKIDRALIDNFVSIQRVMVNLSAKFDNLSTQISKLLELFEISAKSLVRKDMEDSEKEDMQNKKIMEKLDNIAQQANLIGKGLVLIHEAGSDKFSGSYDKSTQPQTPIGSLRQMTPTERLNKQISESKKSPQQRTFEAEN